MSELKTNLQEILQEKTDKIIPENIKKDIQIFDVVGTYEGNGTGGSGDVKLFETEEEMLADTDSVPNQKAIIYRSEKSYIAQNTSFTDMYLPETITLPSQLTFDISIELIVSDGNRDNTNTITISPTEFKFGYINVERSMADIKYISNDGITYIRDYVTVDSTMEDFDHWDFTNDVLSIQPGTMSSRGYYMQYNVTSGDENLAKEFFTHMSYGYYGLFSNEGFDDETKRQMVKNIQLETNGSTDPYDYTVKYDSSYDMSYEILNNVVTLLKTELTSLSWTLLEMINDHEFITYNHIYNYNDELQQNTGCLVNLYNLDGSTGFHVGFILSTASYVTNESLSVHKIDLNTSTVTDITSDYTIVTSTAQDRDYYYISEEIDTTHWFTVINSTNNNTTSMDITSYTETSAVAYYNNMDIDIDYGKYYKYTPAQTQFTLNDANQLFPDVCALGSDGAYTGTLSQNVSNTFEDVNAEIFAKLQLAYDSMEPVVLSSGDTYRNSDIVCIPTKLDGTALLDTSNITNMSSMFRNCTSLVFIPKLNTSNVTNMSYMFFGSDLLTTIPQLDTSSVTDMGSMFNNCTSLTMVPQLNTSSVIDMSYMFNYCTSLTTVPQLDTSSVTDMDYMFRGYTLLIAVPQLDTSSATNLMNMFSDCTNLSDDSLNNILQMCINATSYTSTKTLERLGLTEEQATKCTTLSNWSACSSAGWTTGY